MNPESPFPRNIKRNQEEQQIRRVLAEVKADGRSRAVLLLGDGGVGKTSLVRRMAETNDDPTTDWLEPIDVDDSHYWLLSNLESKITDSLEHPGTYFDRYKDELSRLPTYTRENINRETVVSYLGRVKEIFTKCYNKYLEIEQKTVVIAFDTIETIRGTNQLSTLTQWMKALPNSTLFILSGRPVPDAGKSGGQDPIVEELETPYQLIPVTKVDLGRFGFSDSDGYIADSLVSDALVNQEKDKLIYLTRGQPLWLAFVIDYLTGNDIPEETGHSLEYMAEHIPYDGDMTPEGERLHQAFLRRLLAPYRQSDFWHEAIKRLAVVRQPIDETVWGMLMNDLALPEGTADLAHAWTELIVMPWIRPRGNGKYVTLHDAVAEAFAQRIFPLHDPEQEWRHRIWGRALDIYTNLAEQKAQELAEQERELQSRLRPANEEVTQESSSAQDSEIIDSSIAIDALKRERDELRAARLYYLSLTNFAQGCDLLLYYFQQANKEHDLFIQDLLALYLQRFLPGGTPSGAFDDVIKAKLDDFRLWLTDERPDYYVAIGVMVAAYFIEVARPGAALELLDHLPTQTGLEFQCRIHILRGNACMRIPRRVTEGLPYFEKALEVARGLDPIDRRTFTAEAHKECGFYYRNIGEWESADLAYKRARDTLVATAREQSLPTELDEIASIQTNWAYVKGLAGSYDEGIHLADNAIKLRRQFGSPVEVGISWSVKGEVYRYARRFGKAWAAYATAERLLHERPNWNWLGLIYQEQAICLYQALQDDISLTEDPMTDAKRLITSALDICLSHAIRGYPSALNRAGRIFGHDDPDRGFPYLEKGIVQARRLSDGWFLLANQVEHAELSYRAWIKTGDNQYLSQITEQAPTITEALGQGTSGHRFPDLTGRWAILQGHLALGEYLSNNNVDALPEALEYYKRGFPAIAERSLASSGAALVPGAFENFERLFSQLLPEIRADWQTKLMAAWQGPDEGSKLLRVRLQELLTRLLRGEN
jgi:tetratricopeptide (TPR) repeat protein